MPTPKKDIEEKEGTLADGLIVVSKRSMTTYTDEQKAEALAHLDLNGGLLRKTARERGIPVTTLFQWEQGQGISPRIEQLRTIKREELGQDLRRVAKLSIRLAEEKAEDASYYQLMVGSGIAVQRSAELLDEVNPVRVEVTHKLDLARKAYDEIKDLVPPDEARTMISDELNIDLKPEEWREIVENKGE